MKHNGRKTQNQISTTTKFNMQTEVFWTLLVCLLCTIVLELFLISLKIEVWIEVSKVRQDSLDKMQGIKARYVPLCTVGFWCQTIQEKFLRRFDTIFGVEKIILKFNDGLQSCCCPVQKKSAQRG